MKSCKHESFSLVNYSYSHGQIWHISFQTGTCALAAMFSIQTVLFIPRYILVYYLWFIKRTLVWVFGDRALAACCSTNAVSSCLVSGSSLSPGMSRKGPPLQYVQTGEQCNYGVRMLYMKCIIDYHTGSVASFPGLRPDFISQPWRKIGFFSTAAR